MYFSPLLLEYDLKAYNKIICNIGSEGFNMAECKVACEGFLEILSKLKVLVKTNVRDSYEVMLMVSKDIFIGIYFSDFFHFF